MHVHLEGPQNKSQALCVGVQVEAVGVCEDVDRGLTLTGDQMLTRLDKQMCVILLLKGWYQKCTSRLFNTV